jgi:Asp-tRNA(Asn)/Glu-tRNA(Gln) amidotransferase C subunit
MSKTLWHTIKLEVPKEMVNITKNDKVVIKKSLTKTNNISKANKEPSIKIIPGDTNKPKIISDGKEWNIEELKLKMKKAKELGKKNEGKEYKKEMTKDKAAKIITSEINSRAKLNRADKYLQLKNNSLEELKTIFKRVMQYLNNVDYTSSESTRTINGINDLRKDELIEKIIKLRSKKKDGHLIPSGYFDLSIPLRTGIEHYDGGGYSKKKKGRFQIRV